jgi:hypothetical protein
LSSGSLARVQASATIETLYPVEATGIQP